MNSTLFYTASLGPSVGVPTAMYAPPLRYKREALAAYEIFISKLTQTQAIQHTVDVGYYAPAARTTLSVPCSWGTHSYCAKTRVVIRNYALRS